MIDYESTHSFLQCSGACERANGFACLIECARKQYLHYGASGRSRLVPGFPSCFPGSEYEVRCLHCRTTSLLNLHSSMDFKAMYDELRIYGNVPCRQS